MQSVGLLLDKLVLYQAMICKLKPHVTSWNCQWVKYSWSSYVIALLSVAAKGSCTMFLHLIMTQCIAAGNETNTWVRRTSRARGSGAGDQLGLSRLPGTSDVQGSWTTVANEKSSTNLQLSAHEDDKEHLPTLWTY